MRVHDHDEPRSPTVDLEIAIEALDEGDARHAAHHLAVVLATEPREPGLDEAIERWIGSTRDPLELVDAESEFVGTQVLRAHALHHLGRDVEAVSTLAHVQAAFPRSFWWDRLAEWLPLAAQQPPRPESIAQPLIQCSSHRHLARAMLPGLQLLVERWDFHEQLVLAAVRSARSTGELSIGQSIADAGYAAHPSWMTALARAMILRARELSREAIAAYRLMAQHDPTHPSAWLHIGDIALDEDDIRVAYEGYRSALAVDPAHRWAIASMAYLRWRYEGDSAAREQLVALAETDDRARSLLRRVDPYALGAHPRSSLIDGCAAWRTDPITHAVSSFMEAPSAVLCLRLIARYHGNSEPIVEVPVPGAPDPRVARRPVEHAVWTYKLLGWSRSLGPHARPAGDWPDYRVAKAIAALATEAPSLDRARTVARELSTKAIRSLLAVMAQPPPLPDGVEPWDWVFRVQTEAARVIAFSESGWNGSARKSALDSLLYGPLDWTTVAAMLALTDIASEEPALAQEITEQLLAELEHPMNPLAWTCLHEPLLDLEARLSMDDATRRRVAALRLEWSG